jgi:hypothetical protein
MLSLKQVLALVMATAALAAPASLRAATRPRPLSEADVLKLIELHRQTGNILARLNKAGVDFKVDDEVIERLRKAGASEKVLAAIRRPSGAPSALVKALSPGAPSALVQALIEQLKDRDGKVRRTAADTLGKLGAKEAVPALIQRVADDVWLERPFGTLLGDSSPYDGMPERGSKDRALQVLIKLAPDRVEEALLLAMKSKKPEVKAWALAEIGKLEQKK